MAGAKKKLLKRKGAVRRALDRLETRVMAAAGRSAVRGKVRTVKRVTRKAAKAALAAGALAAAGVVLREVRKPRSM